MPTNTSKPELTPEQKAEKELVAMANQTAKKKWVNFRLPIKSKNL